MRQPSRKTKEPAATEGTSGCVCSERTASEGRPYKSRKQKDFAKPKCRKKDWGPEVLDPGVWMKVDCIDR
jgi:hypothetical protein